MSIFNIYNSKTASSLKDLQQLKPYGNSMNDGKLQLSLTLPVANDERGCEAARLICKRMGLTNVRIESNTQLEDEFTYYVIRCEFTDTVDYTAIKLSDDEPAYDIRLQK